MPVPYAKAPPPPPFSWTGLYVGGNAGWLQLEENGYPLCLDPTGAMQGLGCDIVPGGQMGANGFFGGGQAGYNWQAGRLVLGIEADMQGVSLKASENIPGPFAIVSPFPISTGPASFAATESVTWLGTLRGRFGVAFDRLLIYMTGGLAMGGVDVTQAHIFQPAPPFTPVQYPSNTSRTLNGWTFGGGVEWAFLDRWSVKAEGGYYDLGTIQTLSASVPTVGRRELPARQDLRDPRRVRQGRRELQALGAGAAGQFRHVLSRRRSGKPFYGGSSSQHHGWR